jgi:hypothetical protein
MRIDVSMLRAPLIASASMLALAGCNQRHDAKWYMAHGDAMQAKVRECQADPQRAASDTECAAATEAFVTWARASGQAPAEPAPSTQR